jgi:hypothetical protein
MSAYPIFPQGEDEEFCVFLDRCEFWAQSQENHWFTQHDFYDLVSFGLNSITNEYVTTNCMGTTVEEWLDFYYWLREETRYHPWMPQYQPPPQEEFLRDALEAMIQAQTQFMAQQSQFNDKMRRAMSEIEASMGEVEKGIGVIKTEIAQITQYTLTEEEEVSPIVDEWYDDIEIVGNVQYQDNPNEIDKVTPNLETSPSPLDTQPDHAEFNELNSHRDEEINELEKLLREGDHDLEPILVEEEGIPCAIDGCDRIEVIKEAQPVGNLDETNVVIHVEEVPPPPPNTHYSSHGFTGFPPPTEYVKIDFEEAPYSGYHEYSRKPMPSPYLCMHEDVLLSLPWGDMFSSYGDFASEYDVLMRILSCILNLFLGSSRNRIFFYFLLF